MRGVKRIIAVVVALTATAALVSAQATGTVGRELTVEESYLQETVEHMIIREQSRANSRDLKLVALEYIGDAITNGRIGPEILRSLEFLALEGVVNQTRESGRLVNNFPDVRARAAQRLGELGTVEAKNVLIKMMHAEQEPMVLTEVIKSLGNIGMNENDEVTSAISWVVTRFDILHPDNILALSALEAYEKLVEKNGGLRDASVIRTIMRIAEGSYIRPVQARARETLNTLRKYTVQSR